MDGKLFLWAYAVKARRCSTSGRRLPVLWLFTDARRLADPLAAAAALPRGLAGVVLRDDAAPGREALGRALARICRARRNVLVVAGDARLAARLGAGLHLRGGHGPRRRGLRAGALVTSSAHGAADLRRAVRAGADLAFLSPAFPTASHPGAPALGPLRWGRLAARVRLPVAALGGIDGRSVRRLPASCAGAAAIGALAA
jgi:thiamine-phosphate pyrophosphorylase